MTAIDTEQDMPTYNYESANGGNGTEYHVTNDDGEDLGVVGRDDTGDEWYFLANDFREGTGSTRDDAVEAALSEDEPGEPQDVQQADEPGDGLKRDDSASPAESVTALQNMLTNAGFPPANNPEPTGVFEYHTERAVKKFQKKWGLNVTGEVDAETASLLEDKAGPQTS